LTANVKDLIIFVVFSAAAESLPVNLPSGGGVTVGFAVILSCILLFGMPFAVWVAFLGVFIATAIFAREVPVHKIIFNCGMFAAMTGVSGLVFERLGGSPGDLGLLNNLTPMLITIITYFLLNVFLVTIVLTLAQNLSPYSIWIKNLCWTAPNYLALAPIGILITYIYAVLGVVGLILFIVPLFIARNSFKLYMDMRQVNLETVQALAAAIEAKDPYTKGHSERVAQYAVAIAREMGLPEDEIEIIQYAALLHDIGKIGISEQILNKPAKLSEEEFERIKTHPVIGSLIVERIKFLSKASDLIKYHHERLEGTGYPSGLKSGEIPRGAKILSVADVFDALTSDRPYRKAWSIDSTVKKMIDDTGKEFDPEIVNALIRVLKREGRIKTDAS
jgi:putative nucleotidyltransferase with HDIG domain